MVGKGIVIAETAFRPSIDPKGTLSSILAIKLAAREPAHCFEPPKEVLSQATWEYSVNHHVTQARPTMWLHSPSIHLVLYR